MLFYAKRLPADERARGSAMNTLYQVPCALINRPDQGAVHVQFLFFDDAIGLQTTYNHYPLHYSKGLKWLTSVQNRHFMSCASAGL